MHTLWSFVFLGKFTIYLRIIYLVRKWFGYRKQTFPKIPSTEKYGIPHTRNAGARKMVIMNSAESPTSPTRAHDRRNNSYVRIYSKLRVIVNCGQTGTDDGYWLTCQPCEPQRRAAADPWTGAITFFPLHELRRMGRHAGMKKKWPKINA